MPSYTNHFTRSANFILFLLGLGGAIYIQHFGTFSLSEPLLAGISLISLLFGCKLSRPIAHLLFVNLLWIAGIFLTDICRDIPLDSTLKLFGSVTLFFLNIFAFNLLLKENPKASVFFIAGLGFSYLLQFYYFPPPLAKEMFARDFNEVEIIILTWAALTHYVALMSLAGVLWYMGWVKTSVFIIFVAAVASLYLGSRAYFLIGLFSTFFLFLLARSGEENITFRKLSGIKLLKFVFYIFLITFLASVIYKEAALSGLLGDFAYEKYLSQSSVKGLGLASGRLDFFESVYAVVNSPIVGYGSYAIDDVHIRANFASAFGLPVPQKAEGELIPCHSHILGAWVWSGLLSVPFWVMLINKIIRSLFVVHDFRLLGICIPFALFLMWHILFSPIGYRVDLCFFVGFLFALTHAKVRVKQQLLPPCAEHKSIPK